MDTQGFPSDKFFFCWESLGNPVKSRECTGQRSSRDTAVPRSGSPIPTPTPTPTASSHGFPSSPLYY